MKVGKSILPVMVAGVKALNLLIGIVTTGVVT
jgi:hypothetical protein